VDRRIERAPATALAGQSLDRFYRARGRAARSFARLRRPFEFRLRRDVEPRPPFHAAFLSLIPGLGQLYNYQPDKAAFFLAVWIVLLVAAALTIRMPASNAVLLTLVLWALYAFHDGFRTARRMQGGFWHLRLSLAFFTAWIFQLCILLLLGQFLLGFTVVKFRHMSEPALSPVIDRGDRFAVDVLTYRFRDPRVGDIVYYRPRQIVLDQGQNMYIEAPVNGVERIVAGPGETFSRVRGRYFRNGQPVSPDEAPLNQSEVAWDYNLQAASDSFIVIRSYTSGDTLGAAAPRMFEVLAVMGWEEACQVKPDEIIGRVSFIYNPPEHRRVF
jgi:signal peptidase I